MPAGAVAGDMAVWQFVGCTGCTAAIACKLAKPADAPRISADGASRTWAWVAGLAQAGASAALSWVAASVKHSGHTVQGQLNTKFYSCQRQHVTAKNRTPQT